MSKLNGKRRTNTDFSKHKIKHIKNGNTNIWIFRNPATMIHGLKFINSCGIMAVTGDFDNWIFSREFHPSPEGYVSDSYWIEKCNSSQSPEEYDSNETYQLIKEILEDKDEQLLEDERNFYENLLCHTDDEIDYTYNAYRLNPSSINAEDIPYAQKTNSWLESIFDGFNVMCQQMEKEFCIQKN